MVSPAEPRELRALGKTSSEPEKYGADFLFFSKTLGRVGVQRKEINDLIASLADDRLSREIPLLQTLDVAILLIEGRIEWTNEGLLLSVSSPFTKAQFLGITWSLQLNGLWTSYTGSTTETIDWLSLLNRWATKDRHTSLLRRSEKVRSEYGMRDKRAWQIHIMQGFPGVGYQRAVAVINHFGGLPLAWTGNLAEVDGIGETVTRRLGSLLTPPDRSLADGQTNASGKG